MGQILSYIWRCIGPKQGHDCGDQLNPQPDEDQNHYITIPDADTTRPLSVVVDLSNVVRENEREEEVIVVIKKEGITEVLTRPPLKLSCVPPRKTVRRIGPYSNVQRILLVGEGDFSFSASLAVAFGSAPNIIATSLNSEGIRSEFSLAVQVNEKQSLTGSNCVLPKMMGLYKLAEFLRTNYRKFQTNKKKLEIRGCMVVHGVDATNMVNHLVLGNRKFDCVIFNFPYTGNFGRTDSDLRDSRNLVTGFLSNAKKMTNETDEIHITHKSNGYFHKWDIPRLGCDQGLHFLQEIKFSRTEYPGYHTKFGFLGNKDFYCKPCKTYKFGMQHKTPNS